MSATALLDLLALAAAAATPQAQDCRAITDSAARLACYDTRDTQPVPAAPATSSPAAPMTYAPPPAYTPPPAAQQPRDRQASSASIIRADKSGRIVSVTPRRYGLFRLTLDDGRAFDTATNVHAPPAVGTSVTLRRTLIGTTFLDVPGRDPITVRLVRQSR